MSGWSTDNPLVGRFDDRTRGLIRELLTHALRRQRIRLVNRIGLDIPLQLGDSDHEPLEALQERMRQEEMRLMARIRLEPGGTRGLIALDMTLLFRLLGLLLGEDPWGEPTPADARPLTRADRRVGTHLLGDLVNGWNDVLPGGHRWILGEVTDDPRMDMGMHRAAGMLATTLEVGDPDSPMGRGLIAVPTALVPTLWPDARVAEQSTDAGVARVMPLHVTAVAELARLRMPLSKVRALEVGDTLSLGALRHIEVRVRGKGAFIGEAGSKDGTRCVRVLENVFEAA